MRYGGERFYLAFAVLAYNGSRCLRTLLQRQEAYLVSISKTGFFGSTDADGVNRFFRR
ncbi:hypothetical protein LTSEJOH_4857 [Salmonella enterica subsp. enterica serovar Johannesburg str. S5-703]|nr:hypothetical protein LTSEJOH_4857 [Salmonella enterica subsp. enterica serovar Johannesburg str. S5-703]